MVGTELASESHVGQQIRRALRLWAWLHRVPVLNLFWNASRVAVSYIRRWEVHMLPSGVGGGVTKYRHELCPAEWVGVHVTAKSAAHKYQLAETSERSNCIVFLSFFSCYGFLVHPLPLTCIFIMTHNAMQILESGFIFVPCTWLAPCFVLMSLGSHVKLVKPWLWGFQRSQ